MFPKTGCIVRAAGVPKTCAESRTSSARSMPAPQGGGVAHPAGEVPSWALMFDDDRSVPTFPPVTFVRPRPRPHAMPRHFLLTAAALLACAPVTAAADSKPNVIVFLCDDTGYADIGAQGGKDIP